MRVACSGLRVKSNRGRATGRSVNPHQFGDRVDFQLFIIQTLNGLQLGVMLFLMSAGLTLVFGIMNLINLAHGSL